MIPYSCSKDMNALKERYATCLQEFSPEETNFRDLIVCQKKYLELLDELNSYDSMQRDVFLHLLRPLYRKSNALLSKYKREELLKLSSKKSESHAVDDRTTPSAFSHEAQRVIEREVARAETSLRTLEEGGDLIRGVHHSYGVYDATARHTQQALRGLQRVWRSDALLLRYSIFLFVMVCAHVWLSRLRLYRSMYYVVWGAYIGIMQLCFWLHKHVIKSEIITALFAQFHVTFNMRISGANRTSNAMNHRDEWNFQLEAKPNTSTHTPSASNETFRELRKSNIEL